MLYFKGIGLTWNLNNFLLDTVWSDLLKVEQVMVQ